MRRRHFITLVGGVTVAWPFSARAQQTTQVVVGLLDGQSPDSFGFEAAALRRGLSQQGFVEGRNLRIEERWGEGHDERLPAMAAGLVRQGVALIMCGGSPRSTLDAKAATSTIPIVFATGLDPVKAGFVYNLNRPGGNVTGATFLAAQLSAKRLGLLHQLLPNVTTVAALLNLKHPTGIADKNDLESATRLTELKLHILSADSESEIEAAFAALPMLNPGALLVGADPFFTSNRRRIVALAARSALPAIYDLRAFADDGGLMSYGANINEAYRQAGIYAGRILKGEKPGDLPVVQSAKFEFVINLKTAKTLGLNVPPTLLAIADEVIE